MADNHKHVMHKGGDAVYGLGMIGSAVYFIQNAGSFWEGCVGLVMAILWPAFVVYNLLGFLDM